MLDRRKIDEEFKISNYNKLKKQTQLKTKNNLIVIIVLVAIYLSQLGGLSAGIQLIRLAPTHISVTWSELQWNLDLTKSLGTG